MGHWRSKRIASEHARCVHRSGVVLAASGNNRHLGLQGPARQELKYMKGREGKGYQRNHSAPCTVLCGGGERKGRCRGGRLL